MGYANERRATATIRLILRPLVSVERRRGPIRWASIVMAQNAFIGTQSGSRFSLSWELHKHDPQPLCDPRSLWGCLRVGQQFFSV
jgi:hypothetical protein